MLRDLKYLMALQAAMNSEVLLGRPVTLYC